MSHSNARILNVKEGERLALSLGRWFRFGRVIKRLPAPDNGEAAYFVFRIENEKGDPLERFEVWELPLKQILKDGDTLSVEQYLSESNSLIFSLDPK